VWEREGGEEEGFARSRVGGKRMELRGKEGTGPNPAEQIFRGPNSTMRFGLEGEGERSQHDSDSDLVDKAKKIKREAGKKRETDRRNVEMKK